jgi:hypothetical protein
VTREADAALASLRATWAITLIRWAMAFVRVVAASNFWDFFARRERRGLLAIGLSNYRC